MVVEQYERMGEVVSMVPPTLMVTEDGVAVSDGGHIIFDSYSAVWIWDVLWWEAGGVRCGGGDEAGR